MDWDIPQADRRTLYQQVADSLEEMILSKKIDSLRLPTEFELVDMFGVSRTVVREALKILRERGLVRMRAGDGAYVTRPQVSTMMQAMNRVIRFNNVSDLDVNQVRTILESASAQLACENMTDDNLDELIKIRDEMIFYKDDIDIRVKKDCEFHCAIAKFSRNELLQYIIESITDLLYEYMRRRIELRPSGNYNGIMWHGKIIDAFKTKNPQLAADVMRDHCDDSFRQLDYDVISKPEINQPSRKPSEMKQ